MSRANDGSSRALGLRTLLLARELASGETLTAPVVDGRFATIGTQSSGIAQLQTFLTEYLTRGPPEAVARYALPANVTIRHVDVVIPREDLPRRAQMKTPVSVACIVIPTGEAESDAWVFVVAIDATIFVRKGESFDDVVRSEVRRLVSADERPPWHRLALFPDRDHELHAIDLSLERVERLPAGTIGSLHKAIEEAEKRRWAHEILREISTPLDTTDDPPILHRDAELRHISALLDGRERTSILLTGSTSAGKSALMRAWKKGSGRPVFATSGAQLIAGMSFFGQWQERLQNVMNAAEAIDAVLYFDNIGELMGGPVSSGSVDIPSVMKRWLEEGRVRVVGELRSDLIDSAERRHSGFLGYFSRVAATDLDATRAAQALHARIAHDKKANPDAPSLETGAVLALVDLAERYLPYEAFPGKAMRLYDDLRAIYAKDFDLAGKDIGKDRLYEAFSTRSGIPSFLLRDDRALRLDDVLAFLEKRLVGQGAAARLVAETVCVVKAQLQPGGKPLACFLFVGPTGVGKTELARALASFLFGSPDRLVRFDMSEFADPGAAERLIRGGERGEGLLTRTVREQPFSVVLLDEVEKAHRGVFDLLLQLLGEGRLTDGRGKTTSFVNTIVIMTSNLGAAHRRTAAGFVTTSDPDGRPDPVAESDDAIQAHYTTVVNRSFRPELVNRLDRIVAFTSLTQDEVFRIARLTVERLAQRRGFLEGGVKLDIASEAVAALAEGGFSPAYGARALRRHIEDALVVPLARLIAALGADRKGTTVHVRASRTNGAGDDDGNRHGPTTLAFELTREKSLDAGRGAHDLEALSALRRQVDRTMLFDRIIELRERLDTLIVQMSYGAMGPKAPKKNSQTAQEIAELRGEHHRLDEVWQRAHRAQDEVHSLEEVALTATLDGEPIGELLGDARAVYTRFRKALTPLLLAQERQRDSVTLLVTDLDEPHGHALFLEPLLMEARQRRWAIEVHIDGGKAEGGDAPWDHGRRWSPPRSSERILERMRAGQPLSRSLLLRVQGPWAGVYLAAEQGLHRYQRVAPDMPRADVMVKLIAMETRILDDEWKSKALVPPMPAQDGELRRAYVSREIDVGAGTVIANRRAAIEVDAKAYFVELEDIILETLLEYEEDENLDRTALFAGPLDRE
ncbi:MAG: ATPase with chaperone, two ATP-bindingdomain [Labilithrix sp.]|nr:ATPase with chaperone, two ATP-bindingdomain [Labilithrix sp.]